MKEIVRRRLLALQRFRPAALVLLLGIALLLIPGSGGEEASPPRESEEFDRLALQAEMEQMLKEIEGVGELRLMLMVDAGAEQELAQDYMRSINEKGHEEKRETILLGAGGGTQEVVVTRKIYPRFTGALVVCEGADNAKVRYAVVSAVGVLTKLPSNQISVVKRSS